MAKYTLEKKNYNELYRWAKMSGLEVAYRMPAEELIATIEAAFPGKTEIELEGEDSPEVASVTSGETGQLTASYRDDPKVTVNIATDEENGGKHPVPVCVNGDHILIKRNMPVAIPYRFYLALENAIQSDYAEEEGPNKTTVLVETSRPAFRFTAKGIPSDDVIAAWHERTRNLGRDKVEDDSIEGGAAIEALAGSLLKKLQEGAAA